MRLLIANQIDPAIRDRCDLRAWTQRVLWFAKDGDLIVLSQVPSELFVRYVTGLTGVDPGSLRFLVPPSGRHDGRLIDPESLSEATFLEALCSELDRDAAGLVDAVFPLWPSASVARLADALGLANRLPGAAFLSQGGGEIANNKAAFRALAASAEVAVPDGQVCHSEREGLAATMKLLAQVDAVVVKQAHNGAGVGNQLVVAGSSDPGAVGHVGARHLYNLVDRDRRACGRYWEERWRWASADGRYPVVVEAFVPHSASVFSEHFVGDDTTRPTEMGSLHFVDRHLKYQIVPLAERAGGEVREQLLDGGTRLADTYRALGYRGYLSADAVVTSSGAVVFTEVNAQVSGSLHIYEVIANEVVRVNSEPRRLVVECHSPEHWSISDTAGFLEGLDALGLSYDPAERRGVILSIPLLPQQGKGVRFLYCIAAGDEDEWRRVEASLESWFGRVAASPTPMEGLSDATE